MKQLLLLTTLLIMFSSCKQGDDINFDNDVQASFSLVVSDIFSDCSASALPLSKTTPPDLDPDLDVSANEKRVQNIWVLQFDGTEATSKLVIDPTYITVLSPTSVDGQKIQVVLKDGNQQTVYFIANTFDSGFFSDIKRGDARSKVDLMGFEVSKIPPDYMPMFGSETLNITNAIFSNPQEDKVDLKLLFSKVKFTFTIPTTLDPDTRSPEGPQIKSLLITQVNLVNCPKKVNVISEPSPTQQKKKVLTVGGIIPPITLKTEADLLSSFIYGTPYIVEFYMPENIAGIVAPCTAAVTGTNFFNDYTRPSDKFGDFNKSGKTDHRTVTSGYDTEFPAYIELVGVYIIGEKKYTAKFRIYLGIRDAETLPLYNNYNVNAGYYYTVKSAITSVNETDQRVDLAPAPLP